MNILAINCGSSTLKFQLIEVETGPGAFGHERRLATGLVEAIGGLGSIEFTAEHHGTIRRAIPIPDHTEAVRQMLAWLDSVGLMHQDTPQAVGHRVVHGGDWFVEPTVIDDRVITAIEAVSDLAPLHNAPSLAAIRATRAALGPTLPMVATFDTAFHRTLPEHAAHYALPWELSTKHRIRRYGFHGLAHRYMAERYATLTSSPTERLRLVTLQLGNGCSATAIAGGRSLDTSMGFTPLEGLMMGTRSGDIDPSLPGFLVTREGVSIGEVENWLNTRSGLLGVSGRSSDMREVLAAEHQGDTRAALAVEMFCYRVRKYIGTYLAVLGGADAVIFGGGIGENNPVVRDRICRNMDWCGLVLDPNRNLSAVGTEMRISRDDAKLHAYVIPVDEEIIIARDTVLCLQHNR